MHLLPMLLALSDKDTVSQNARKTEPRFLRLVVYVVARDDMMQRARVGGQDSGGLRVRLGQRPIQNKRKIRHTHPCRTVDSENMAVLAKPSIEGVGWASLWDGVSAALGGKEGIAPPPPEAQ